MVDSRGRSVGRYVMRLVGGVAVILGILGAFSSLADGNLVGIVLSALFLAGGVFLLKRSGDGGRAGRPASVPRDAR
ncbi:hypothetical protein [Micromonospora maritima]|uniref:hypothetical protein n=1 Tax=Micromonospora maritima TaxID=986711 RepID=UPI0037B77DD2